MEAIYDFIARRDRRLSVAKDVVRKLRDHCDQYATLTTAGHVLGTPRDDLASGIRVFAYRRWVIVFRAASAGLEVLRIFDGATEYGQVFQNEMNS